jgi:hypothetical protein
MSAEHDHKHFQMDRWGLALSSLCLFHCLGTPFVLLLFPLVAGASGALHQWIHVVLAAILIPIALKAVTQGYRHHKKRIVPILAGSGTVFIVAGALAPLLFSIGEHNHAANEVLHMSPEIWATIVGSVLLLICHSLNIWFCRPGRASVEHSHSRH